MSCPFFLRNVWNWFAWFRYSIKWTRLPGDGKDHGWIPDSRRILFYKKKGRYNGLKAQSSRSSPRPGFTFVHSKRSIAKIRKTRATNWREAKVRQRTIQWNSTHVRKIRIRLLAEKFTKLKNVQGSRVMVAVWKREKLDRRKWFSLESWSMLFSLAKHSVLHGPRQCENASLRLDLLIFSFPLSLSFVFFSVFFNHTIRQSATTRLNIWSDCVHNLGLLLSGSVCALQTIKICFLIIFITLYLSVLVCVFDLFVFCFCRFFYFLF